MSIRTVLFSALAAGTVLIAVAPAGAQGYGRPPAPIGGGYDDDDTPLPRNVAGSDDAAGQAVRIDKLESQMRQLTGQIEQLQFANHRLEDQLKKFQSDVDFRFQDVGHGGAARPQKRGDAGDGGTPSAPVVAEAVPASAAPVAPPATRARRGDAFDPTNDPNAPGAPRPIGSLSASSPPPRGAEPASIIDDGGSDAPLDLSGGRLRGSSTGAGAPPVPLNPGGSVPSRPNPSIAAVPSAPAVTPGGTVMASIAPSGPKEEFDVALGYYKDKQYDNAEKGFAALVQKYPKGRIAPDALYYLGETYYARGRQREAAEQFLKISTDYGSATRAPDAMLRLGQSLNALGAKEQACATFGEIGRKYPNAANAKSGADRESKRLQCPAT
jgi:tol-pal system protein YbgF